MLTIPRSLLKTVLQSIRRVVQRSNTMPVLGCVRCSKDNNGVTITATDLDRTLRCSLPPESWTGAEGAFLVPLAELVQAARGNGGDSPITVESRDEDVVAITTVIAGQPVPRIVGSFAVDDFPPCPIPSMDMAAMDAKAFLNAYRLAAPYVSRDDTRGVLQGIYLESQHNKLVATDGRRLTAVDLPMVSLTENAVLPVVPLLTGRLDIEGEILVGLKKTDAGTVLRVDTADWTLTGPCIEGTYPNYRQVVPAQNPEPAAVFDFSRVPAAVLKEALAQFAREPDAPVVLYGDPDRVVLAGHQPQGGQRLLIPLADARCETERWMAVGVNPAFFEEPLKQGFTRIEVQDDLSPLRFTGESVSGVHVLMPIHGGDMTEVREAITGEPEPAETEDTASEPGNAAAAESPAEGEDPGQAAPAPVTAAGEDAESTSEADQEDEQDPRDAFRVAMTEAVEAVRAADKAVRTLKTAARDYERHTREQIKVARAAARTKAVKFRGSRDEGMRKAS